MGYAQYNRLFDIGRYKKIIVHQKKTHGDFRRDFPLEIIATEFDVTKSISSELAFALKVFSVLSKIRYGEYICVNTKN